ncbi:MAG: hypothetical protein ACFFCT_14910, partial [Candidatus Odinarchaeota archaeon]
MSMTPADKMLYSVVKLDVYKKKKQRWGTGFYFFYKKNERVFPFIVTNRHVVEGCDKGVLTFQSSENQSPNPHDKFGVELVEMDSFWTYHPDTSTDVAVAPWMTVYDAIKKLKKEPFLV